MIGFRDAMLSMVSPVVTGILNGSSAGMMQTTAVTQNYTTVDSAGRSLEAARTVLIIDAAAALRYLAPRPDRQAVIVTQKRMLCASMLQTVRPDAVIGPLITADWDIVDLGLALQSLGYRGDLYALTRPLPRAELVVREVGAVCPSLNVMLLETG